MKNRSHRLPQSDFPDDWVDGSWTVDCSCGVMFDDGEEMVSCDECGVWVHTRCSRFIKGETSFACHNCKKNNNNNVSNSCKNPPLAPADTDEAEVAQLLIEFPTKTDPSPPPNPFTGPAYRAPFRMWAKVPMDDRVHVQGVPGGDPSLFQGNSSSVFTSNLWRCTGYVPKKFNFQYREFSCWEEDVGQNPASRGADVLFSLSKEIVPSCVPVRAFERKHEGGEKVVFGPRLQSRGKERNKLRLFGSHASKKRKEDWNVKKKKVRSDAGRVAAEFKKRGSFVVADAKKGRLSEDRCVQLLEIEVATSKSEGRKEGEPVVGVDSGKKKKAGSDDRIVADEHERRSVSVHVADTSKAEGSADGCFQITELNVPSVKSEERKEDVAPQKVHVACVKSEGRKEGVSSPNNTCHQVERTDGNVKPKLVMKASKGGPADDKPRLKNPSELCVKVETEDESTEISLEADVPAASQDKQDNNVKQHVKEEKNEKGNQPVPQSSPKFLKHSISMRPPSSTRSDNTRGDQEYALRLHQELNSSPRVPRVPRIRQASGLQTSQSAPSMLSKRHSHSGGRDQPENIAFRRKNKEGASRDGSHNSQETIDESKKAGRAMSSPDRKYRESYCRTGGSTKKDSRSRSPDTVVSMKKSGASIGSENSCCPSAEASGQNALSIKSSPRDVHDDDTTTRTLPGLIDEILSSQNCSTYEELCDAVRLYWQNVRKPNGERYAYSSHSHAVLDCLRNRSEWAHLIDRGPKTNSSKRRRKIDSDTPTVEELETADARNIASSMEMEDKNREDFPKGKRKARKRRRLESHDRRMEEARKRKCASSSGSAIVSDDDVNDDEESAAAFSHLSNNEGDDGMLGETESQGAINHAVGGDASASASPDGSR